MFQSGQQVRSKDWNPELGAGRHHRARLGFILMSTDLAAEADFFDMAPEGVAVHITRLKTDDYTTNETLSRHIDHMADAASRIQPDTKPDVISYSAAPVAQSSSAKSASMKKSARAPHGRSRCASSPASSTPCANLARRSCAISTGCKKAGRRHTLS
jgi:hypothetical protein